MPKQWYEDWFWEEKSNGRVTIKMPNAHGPSIISFKKMSDARVRLLFEWWQCAMDQIQRDHGGYEHAKK